MVRSKELKTEGLTVGRIARLYDLGDVALRGFEDPVRLFEVRWREGEFASCLPHRCGRAVFLVLAY